MLSSVLPGLSRKQAWALLRTSGAAASSQHKTAGRASSQGTIDVYKLLDSLAMGFTSRFTKPAPTDAPWVSVFMRKVAADILVTTAIKTASAAPPPASPCLARQLSLNRQAGAVGGAALADSMSYVSPCRACRARAVHAHVCGAHDAAAAAAAAAAAGGVRKRRGP